MKKLLILLLAIFTVSTAQADLDSCFSGSWYDPEFPGEGINVEVGDDYVLVYFYDASGQWTFFQGEGPELTMFQPYGDGNVYDVGDGYFVPLDNDTVEFGFDQLLDIRDVTRYRPIPWCLRSDCEREFVYKRLTQPIPCE